MSILPLEEKVKFIPAHTLYPRANKYCCYNLCISRCLASLLPPSSCLQSAGCGFPQVLQVLDLSFLEQALDLLQEIDIFTFFQSRISRQRKPDRNFPMWVTMADLSANWSGEGIRDLTPQSTDEWTETSVRAGRPEEGALCWRQSPTGREGSIFFPARSQPMRSQDSVSCSL